MKFTRLMALDLIEDELAGPDTQFARGMATGLCGAFYMCDLISKKEWEMLLARIEAPQMRYVENRHPVTYH